MDADHGDRGDGTLWRPAGLTEKGLRKLKLKLKSKEKLKWFGIKILKTAKQTAVFIENGDMVGLGF